MTERADFKGARVLVVEDNLLIALSLQMLLEKAGCEVVGPCGSLDDAMNKVHEEHIDSAILDYRLDGQTTEPVATELSARNIKFIVLSGYTQNVLPPVYKGAAALLTKPVGVNDLRTALATALLSRET